MRLQIYYKMLIWLKKVKHYKLDICKNKKIIKFGDIEIQKRKCHPVKESISIKNIDINKIVVSNKVSFAKKGFKYFTGYKDAKKFDAYVYFYQKCVHIEKTLMKLNVCSFSIKDDDLLEKYNEIWEEVKNIIKKEFDREPVYNEKYLKLKIKSYNGKISTNSHNNKIPKEGSQFICSSVFWSILFLEQTKVIIQICF